MKDVGASTRDLPVLRIELVEVLIALHQRPTDDVMIATAAAVARAGNPPGLRARLADFGATVGP